MSSTKLRRVAQKTLSVGLAATTSLWLTGSAFLVAVPVAHALGNEAVVTDITGDNPRISVNGESERIFLGINLARTDNTDVVQLGFIEVQVGSTDGAAEAAVANVEEVRVYRDSSLSGTNGVFDENDSLIHSVVRTEAGATSTTVGVDTASGNGAGDTCLSAAATAGIDAADDIKVGAGLTAEVRDVAAVLGVDCEGAGGAAFTVDALTYTHIVGEVIREVNTEGAATIDEFDNFAAGATAVQLGDAAGGAVMTGAYDIPKTNSSDEQGDDIFVALVTQGGIAAQNVTAQVWTGDIGYRNTTGGGSDTAVSIATGTNTTDGTTKDVELGADGEAPSITKVETYDNNKNGRVDRIKVYFNESMADTVTASTNFVDALGLDQSEINALGAAEDDIDLEANGTWSTTTVLNDTLQLDFTGDADNTPNNGETAGEYNDAVNSTGDTWSVVYDESINVPNQLKDATGENLLDTTITTTDMARPEMTATVELKDNDGDDQVDSLEVTWSETLSSSSDAAGYRLTNTTENPDKDYTLGAVTSFTRSAGVDSNSDDTMVIAITEFKDDANDVFNLDYTASATVTDTNGNEGNSETNRNAVVDIAPRIEKVEYQDLGNGGGNVADGRLDTVLITFTRAVDFDAGSQNDFAVAGYGALAVVTANDGDTTATYSFAEQTFDTDQTPELTYAKQGGDAATICLVNGNNNCLPATDDDTPLENVVAGDVIEEDDAPPVLRSATLYEADNDSIWETADTVQLLFSEDIDPAQIATGWNVSGADGDTAWVDWQFQTAGNAALADNQIPDSGTIAVAGRVITLSATVNATTAIGATDEIDLVANEVKDLAGNSAVVLAGGIVDLALTLNPVAPTVDRIETRDYDGDGVLDGFEVEFGGVIDASTISMAEWAAARAANAFGTENVAADLTLTSVTTVSGGNDTRIKVQYMESNEGTGGNDAATVQPAVKYVGVTTLKDLADNEIADFNQFAGDTALFESPLATPAEVAVDGADPVNVLKRLRDRNSNGQYDQLVLVFSENMNANTTSTDGWEVSGHSLASAGAWSNNGSGDYDSYTFMSTQVVFKVDILEGGVPTSLPSVTYASTGAYADDAALVLGDVAAGGEESPDITNFVAPPVTATVDDGELFQLAGGDGSIWIAKHVGAKKFRRHVLWGDFDVIYPHLAPMWPVQETDQATYDMYTLSAWIRVVGTAPVYEVNDDMTAHWITCDDDPVAGQDCANEWLAAGGDPDGIFEINGSGGEWARLTLTNPVILPDVTN